MDKITTRFNWNEPNSLSTSLPSSTPRSAVNEKLQARFDKKRAKYQLQIVTNRVSQLNKIKSLAAKEIENLQREIKKEQANINFKTKSLEKKRKYLSEQADHLEYKKQQIRKSREENKKNIKDLTNYILKKKQDIVHEKREQTANWKNNHASGKDKEWQARVNKCKEIKSGYVKSLRDRCLNQREYKEKVKARYYESIDDEKKEELEAMDHINELEVTEASIIQELSRTVEIRKSLKDNLKRLRNLSIN
ncbi:hypothetical protein SteCoe_24064 [Stentor coeruleus]|uniref:Uncharacterized protein n=1 Tax=Stentor coeruleus TaxID=5963 RepID=A0A1R2BIH1_9CILI|nr:hypothetical protein SteCoe_24064 [Stentor coeruleus]